MKKLNCKLSDLINHRVIVVPDERSGRDDLFPREYILRELSPSGEMTRWENGRGKFFWCKREDYVPMEDLGAVVPKT